MASEQRTRALTTHDEPTQSASVAVGGKWYYRVIGEHCVKYFAVTVTQHRATGMRLCLGERELNRGRHWQLINRINAAYGTPALTFAQQRQARCQVSPSI